MKSNKWALAAMLFAGGGCLAMAVASAQDKPHAAIGAWGFDTAGMDGAVKPGDDFFRYANGKWFAGEQIPADRTWMGVIPRLRIRSEEHMKALVAGLEARDPASLTPEERQMRDFYDSYVDTKAIEAAGLKPVEKDLKHLAALKTHDDVARAMGVPDVQAGSFFATFVATDIKNSSAYVMYANQSGLGMPDRDYYIRDDKALAETRDAYRKYLATMLTLSGAKDADTRAGAVFDLETQIARVSWAAADRRDADKTYNPMTISELEAYAPGFAWKDYFAAQGLSTKGPRGDRIVVLSENTAFPPLAALFAKTPVPVLRDYLTIHYLHNYAPYLPARFDDADFAFYGKVLDGKTQQLPRDTRAMHELDNRFGHPLGKLYVAKYFTPDAKAKVEALVDNLLKAYDADIRQLDWMTPATKEKALEKLHAFRPHIGYPDKWRDYSGLRIVRGDLIGDVQRSDLFQWRFALDRIDQPVDRNEWDLTPPTVNADYRPDLNSIFFPAGILQPPVFDPNADDAVNYGAIGAVIGHEISHGFDDQGSKFDAAGNLKSWWTDEDRKAFDARTDALSAQYDSYEPLPGLHVNGKLTLGENIADVAGLTIAYNAYHISLGGKPAPVIDGYTGDQRLFLAYAQYYRAKMRDSFQRQLVLSDPHSPVQFRAIGTPRNLDTWYAAFGVKPGDKYYLPPEKRVRLW
ncbi:MAG: M13 family metallopeptidase [Rhizomicrobium sp.]